MKLRAVRGTHDIYGKEIIKFNKIKKCVEHFGKISNFNELNTPIFELSTLFLKPLGEHSDVVLKEMYTFEDRNNELLTLRPEYTTPMIRAAISNNLLNHLPCKLFGLGPMFRRERPQKGRFRQFNQINFENFGSNDPISDIELISVAHSILKNLLPNQNLSLNINSLGNKEELLEFKNKLTNYFLDKKNKLSEESIEKINKNPLRILDSKNKNDIDVSKNGPVITEYLSPESYHYFDEIKNGLKNLDIKFIENTNLVRGLDYYCHTVFEFKTDSLGSQDTILGGGRYDGLISTLGGPDIPGVGWAAGIERIAILMDDLKNDTKSVHIAITDKKYKTLLIKLLHFLKSKNIPYFWNYKYNLKKSLSKANDNNAKNIIIIGEESSINELFSVKNLLNGKQVLIKIDEIENFLKNDQS